MKHLIAPFIFSFGLLISSDLYAEGQDGTPPAKLSRCEHVHVTAKQTGNGDHSNPFLQESRLDYRAFNFDAYQVPHFLPALEAAIVEVRAEILAITTSTEPPNFDNTIIPYAEAGATLDRVVSVFSHYSSVNTSAALREIEGPFRSRQIDISTEIQFNRALFERIEAVYQSRFTHDYTPLQIRLIEKIYEGYRDSGATLDAEKKDQLTALREELSDLQTRLRNNTLDETMAFSLHIEDAARLPGIPQDTLAIAAEEAVNRDLKGWIFTLEESVMSAVLKSADDRELRRQIYLGYSTRGAKEGPHDNREIIKRIVVVRDAMAKLLGFESHAAMVLEHRMAKDVNTVNTFLAEMIAEVYPQAEKDLAELKAFKQQQTGSDELAPWDLAYWGEKLRKAKLNFDSEELKAYFLIDRVIEGMFTVANKLYGLTFTVRGDLPVYHPDVMVYEVQDKDGSPIGILYADFFSRLGAKQGGAFMNDLRSQTYDAAGNRVLPLIVISTNVTKSKSPDQPTLLSFGEAETFFHEFGHALHGLLSNVPYGHFASPNIAWDMVELPSQFMEYFLYTEEGLNLFARHYQTGQPMPPELIANLIESKRFQAGLSILRQLELATLDMAWYSEAGLTAGDVEQFEIDAVGHLRLTPRPAGSLTSPAFAHIFAGGYSAGYYSYQWAEALSADAFSAFETSPGGLFDPTTTARFRTLLESGSARDAADLYRDFSGRDFSRDAYMIKSGFRDEP